VVVPRRIGMTKVYVVTTDQYDLFDESKRFTRVEAVFANKKPAQDYVDYWTKHTKDKTWSYTFEITETGVIYD
jgi:hypothetical protein